MKLEQPMEVSAAKLGRFVMAAFDSDEFYNTLELTLSKITDEERDLDFDNQKELLDNAKSPVELVNVARKVKMPTLKRILGKKILENESETLPLILKRYKTSQLDTFIETSILVLAHCDEKYVDELLNDYDGINSPYAKSEFCVVLGFRNRVDCRDFLQRQYELLKKECGVRDHFEQGPLIALWDLKIK